MLLQLSCAHPGSVTVLVQVQSLQSQECSRPEGRAEGVWYRRSRSRSHRSARLHGRHQVPALDRIETKDSAWTAKACAGGCPTPPSDADNRILWFPVRSGRAASGSWNDKQRSLYFGSMMGECEAQVIVQIHQDSDAAIWHRGLERGAAAEADHPGQPCRGLLPPVAKLAMKGV